MPIEINLKFLSKYMLEVEKVLLSSNIKFITSNSEDKRKIKFYFILRRL